jgi:hypothetical protein
MTATIQVIILALLGALFGLSALSRRYPHIRWLQAFRIKRPQVSEEQRARMQRRANIHAGIQFILLGLGVPAVYVVSSVMMFNDPSTAGLIISGTVGFALMVVGMIAIWTSRRRPRPPNREFDFYKGAAGRPWDPPAEE